MKSGNLVLGVCAMIFSAAIVVAGRSTGLVFFRGITPGTGFVPFLTAGGIAFCGLVLALGSLKPKAKADPETSETKKDPNAIWIFKRNDLWNFFVVIGASISIVYFARPLGLLVSLSIGVAVMSKLLGTPGWRTPILVGIFSLVMFYLVFDLFLRASLPRGIFGI